MDLNNLADGAGRTTNPFAIVPVWILDPDLYLPGVPDPGALKSGDEKPLTGSEIRVYVALKSFADRSGYCHPHMSTVATRAGVDKSSAERAVAKFKRLGWVESKRTYREKDDARWISGCTYWVVEECPKAARGAADLPVGPRVPHPRDGGYPTRGAEGAMNTPREYTQETHLGSDQISTTSTRSAPSGGGATENEDQTWAARDLNEIRRMDEELFESIVGARLKSTGRNFTAGTFTAHQIYLGMMKWKVKKRPVTWPGRLVEEIHNDGIGDGVEYFLATYGLERVEV
jgi:hypothetical protein